MFCVHKTLSRCILVECFSFPSESMATVDSTTAASPTNQCNKNSLNMAFPVLIPMAFGDDDKAIRFRIIASRGDFLKETTLISKLWGLSRSEEASQATKKKRIYEKGNERVTYSAITFMQEYRHFNAERPMQPVKATLTSSGEQNAAYHLGWRWRTAEIGNTLRK